MHYPLLHAFLALAMAYHSGVHNRRSADVVEKLLSALYVNSRTYSYIKENYKRLAEALAAHAAKHRIVTNPQKTKEVMERAFEKTFKIIDKLLPEVNEENLEVLGRAIHKHTNDPFVVLRNAGIDIEPELEEFRQFLAEISGKKPPAPKFKQVQKEVEEELRAKGVPEEMVKVAAPRLATVKYFEEALNAMDHEVYRNLGGVPAEYVKKVRNMALAKKLAAEHIFSVWAREGIRPVLLSEAPEEHKELIERHARDIYEDTKHIAEAHRKGLLEKDYVFSVISAERNLADKIYEITGKLLSDSSALREIPEEHRTALKVLTGNDPGKFMVKMDRLKEYSEVIKMHMEKTRPIIVKRVDGIRV